MFDSNGLPTGWLLTLVIFLVLWSGVWKAIALWKAARNNALAWFIIFCVLNTAGILDPPAMLAAGLAGRNNIYFRFREKRINR